MKAIVGRSQVRAWLGDTMSAGMLSLVDAEHAERGTVRKCSAMFETFKCCRVKGHDGFHVSRTVDGDEFIMTAVWQKE